MEDVVVAPPNENDVSSPAKEMRLKHQAGTLTRNDLIEWFKRVSPKYFNFRNEVETGEENSLNMICVNNVYVCVCLSVYNYRYSHTYHYY